MLRDSLKSLSKWERWFLLCLILLSLGLRFGYVGEMSQTLFLTHLRLDELFNNNWAKSIAAGNIIGDQVYFRAPLYAYWLGLNFAIFGHSYIIPRIIQHILGAISVLLVYFLARKLFGKPTAAVSSLLLGTYAPIIYNEDKFLLESILLPLVIIFFSLFYYFKDKPSFSRWLLLGFVFGLICITRPVFFPLIIFFLFLLIVLYKNKFGWAKAARWSTAILIGTIVIIAPITIRNYMVGKDTMFIASQGGINFYMGNNQSTDGFSSTMPGIGIRWENRDIDYPIRQMLGRTPKISEIDLYWTKQAIHYIISQPFDFLSLTIKKLYLFWNYIEIPNNNSFYLYSQFSKLLSWLPVGFGMIAPLGLLGMLLAFREKRARMIIIYIIIYTFITILFFACDRFRLPFIPFLCIFSGLSIAKLWGQLKVNSKGRLLRFLTILIGLALFINSNLFHFQIKNRSSDVFHLGNLELSTGNFKNAISYYQQIEKSNILIPDLYLNWGVAEWKAGNIDGAILQFHKEISNVPNSYDAIANLAQLYNLINKPDQALSYAQRAVQVKPYAAKVYSDLAFALSALQKYDIAESTLTSFLKSYGENAFYEQSVLANIHLLQGKLDTAESEYRSILQKIKLNIQPGYEPESQYSAEYRIGENWKQFQTKIYYSLGHISIQRQQLDSALIHFWRSAETFPRFADAWIDLGTTLHTMGQYVEADSALSAGLQINPSNHIAWFNYGLLKANMNQWESAERAFTTSLRYNPQFEEAEQALKSIREKLKRKRIIN